MKYDPIALLGHYGPINSNILLMGIRRESGSVSEDLSWAFQHELEFCKWKINTYSKINFSKAEPGHPSFAFVSAKRKQKSAKHVTGSELHCGKYFPRFSQQFVQLISLAVWWHISAITCQIIMLTCQIFMLTCQIFMLTCQIFMLTCHLFPP